MANDRKMMRALNILTKWRLLLAGWQLGTRVKGDPEADAVRYSHERALILRAELTALTALMIDKKVFTEQEWCDNVEIAATLLNKDLAARYPGVTAHLGGLDMDLAKIKQAGWMEGWKL